MARSMPGNGADATAEALAGAAPGLRELLRTVGAEAEAASVQAYAVGGFVRDLLLGRPTLDLDIVVEGDGVAFAGNLGRALGARLEAVPRFGTAHVFLAPASPDMPSRLDVATARREVYAYAGALPVVAQADLRQDLYRRDFTINAMAIPLHPAGPGHLVDFFDGLNDLRAKQVRVLHTLSFMEDPTRLLRAVRFARRYSFRLEPETALWARQAVQQGVMERVSMERLRNELILLLKEPASGGAMAALAELGALPWLLPGVILDEELAALTDLVDQLATAMPDLAAAGRLWPAKLAVLLHRLPVGEALKAVARLKLPRAESRTVVHALTSWRVALDLAAGGKASRAELVRTLVNWSPDGLLFLCVLGAAETVIPFWREWRHIRLAITGTDLIKAGVPAGPRVGRALERVLADRLSGLAPDRPTQLALALRYAQEEDSR